VPRLVPTLVPRLAAEYRPACRQFDADHGEQAESGPNKCAEHARYLRQGRCHALSVREPYGRCGVAVEIRA